MRFAAQGYMGGKSGAKGAFKTSMGTRPNPKLSLRLPAGTRFTLDLPGGGGFHDPLTRDPEAVAEDIAEGLVTPKSGRRDYGVDLGRKGRVGRPGSRRGGGKGAN